MIQRNCKRKHSAIKNIERLKDSMCTRCLPALGSRVYIYIEYSGPVDCFDLCPLEHVAATMPKSCVRSGLQWKKGVFHERMT